MQPHDAPRSEPAPHSTSSAFAPTFPILELQGRRQAAGVSRQRGLQPDAAAGDRPPGALPDHAARQHPSRGALPVRDRDRRIRGGAPQAAAFHQCARRPRNHLHQRHHRGDQPGDARLWPQVHRGRRRDHPDHARAPLEHRAVADAVRGEGREDPRGADQRRAANCWSTNTRACSTSAPNSSA